MFLYAYLEMRRKHRHSADITPITNIITTIRNSTKHTSVVLEIKQKAPGEISCFIFRFIFLSAVLPLLRSQRKMWVMKFRQKTVYERLKESVYYCLSPHVHSWSA